MLTSTQRATLTMMGEQGNLSVPADSLAGNLYRPVLKGWPNGRIATLETLFDFFINNVPDPDSALAQDPDFDEKLRQQPDVHAAMRVRELTVASMPADIVASNKKGVDEKKAQQVADYVEDVFMDLPRRSELYRIMQNAVLMGGQGVEFVWAKGGPGGPKAVRPVQYFPVHKDRFVFDRLGNMSLLTRDTPVWGAYVAASPDISHINDYKIYPTMPGKFIYHKYVTDGGRWTRPASEGYVYYGRGEDTYLYIPVTFDNFVLRFRMKWMEKHGMPLTIMHYRENASLAEVKAVAAASINESVVSIPFPSGGDPNAYYSLEFIEPPATGEDIFARFSEEWTKPRVEKIIMGGANLLQVGANGSYGAVTNQRDAGPEVIFKWDAAAIDETINQQLIPYIVRANPAYADLPAKYFPMHKMAAEVERDRAAEMEIVARASQYVPLREDDVYEASGFSRPKDGEKTVGGPSPQNPDGENAEEIPTNKLAPNKPMDAATKSKSNKVVQQQDSSNKSGNISNPGKSDSFVSTIDVRRGIKLKKLHKGMKKMLSRLQRLEKR